MNIDRLGQLWDIIRPEAVPLPNDQEATDVGAVVWEGNVGNVVGKMGLNQPQATYMKDDLETLECIVQERKGAASVPSRWLLVIDPREAPGTSVNDPRRLFVRERSSRMRVAKEAEAPRDRHIRNLRYQDEALWDEITKLQDKLDEALTLARMAPGLMLDVRELQERVNRLEKGAAA